MDPLRLYWWNKAPNFGDALSHAIVAHVSGRPVSWAPEQQAEIFAIGSIMWHARKGVVKRAPETPPPAIWGTGCMEPIRADWLSGADVAALRGPLSAGVLGLGPVPFGDPGLLAPLLTGPVERGDDIGLILHHVQPQEPRPGYRLIDMRSSDVPGVLRQIASCRTIVSQSLHGIIVADAYGIPNTLLPPDGIHRSAWFKFLDYFASVGRVPEADGPPRCADPGRIDDLRAGLIAAFPAALRAQP